MPLFLMCVEGTGRCCQKHSVTRSRVKEKGGRARVRCTVGNADELNDVKALVLQSIEGAGFSDPVISHYILDEQT